MTIKYAKYTQTAAAARAAAKVGHSNVVGMCAHEVIVNIFDIPPPWDWAGKEAWAYHYWLGAVAHGKVVKTTDPMKVPAGAMVLFAPRKGATTVGGKAGHISVGAGGGYHYSTDQPTEGRWGRVKIADTARLWSKPLLGYILVTGDGHTVTDPPKPPPPPPPPLPPGTKTFRVMVWNTKAPELTITGVHKWVTRRAGIILRIRAVRPTVLGMIESGSGSNLTWYKTALKAVGLTWAAKGGKWQNTWHAKGATYITSGLHALPSSILLNGDNKELNWTVLRIDGKEWLFGVGHPENENGTDKKTHKTGEQIRQLQVAHYLEYLDKVADAHLPKRIPERRRVLLIDGNSPTGGVKRMVTDKTHYRDVFDLATKTAGEGSRTNNKWAPTMRVLPGVQERIDLILIGGNYEDTTIPPRVTYANNHDEHKLSDHNDQHADIANL